MEKVAIIHYDEIALKGANRSIFEQALVTNIARKIKARMLPLIVENTWGRIVVRPKQDARWESQHDKEVCGVLAHTPGVTVFGIGVTVTPDWGGLVAGVQYVLEKHADEFATFRITTTRVDKTYPGTSQQLDRDLGSFVYEDIYNGTKKVQLNDADVVIRVEILKDKAYVYIKQTGISGLPIGTGGKAVALLSGGFDSPVAAYLCATRGVEPLLMHFHAYPQTSRAAQEKVEELARALARVWGPVTFASVPLLDAQKTIALSEAPEKLRVVLYRRLMMRVAEQWGRTHDAKAIITGDSIGQVASQTLENLGVVSNATALPVLRPLCGMHKRDIINKAQEIGTYDISKQPHDDTCTIFVPKRPETKAQLHRVHRAEESYDSEQLVRDMLARAEVQELHVTTNVANDGEETQ